MRGFNTSVDIPAVVITLVVIAAIAFVGVAVVGEIDDEVDMTRDGDKALHQRADQRYGDDYTIVSSDVCWDYCAPTAADQQRRERTVLLVADNADAWVSEFTLAKSVSGMSAGQTADRLVGRGLLEKRDRGFLHPQEYRYVGPDGKYEGRVTDAELRTRIDDQLYVFQGWLYGGEIARSVPASETRVEGVLQRMAADGEIEAATEDRRAWFPWERGPTVYADQSVSVPPNRHEGMFDLTGVVLLVLIAAVIIGLLQTLRTRGGDEVEPT